MKGVVEKLSTPVSLHRDSLFRPFDACDVDHRISVPLGAVWPMVGRLSFTGNAVIIRVHRAETRKGDTSSFLMRH